MKKNDNTNIYNENKQREITGGGERVEIARLLVVGGFGFVH